MVKKLSINKIIFLMAFLVSGLFLFNGCTFVNKVKELNETPPIMEISSDTIHEINVMELKETPQDKTETVADYIQGPELEKIELSLEECRAFTLENNLDLQAELINPTIEEENISQAEAQFEAAFSGSASYSKSDSPTDSLLIGSSSESSEINLGVDLPLRTGGTLSFDLVDSVSKTNSTWSTLNPSYSNRFTASISQPLLKDAGRRASTYRIRVAQYNSSLVDLRTKLAVIRIIAEVDKAYWRLYASRRMLDVRKQQYDLAKATFEETERFVEVGAKPKIEIIRTKKTMADTLEGIIRAENDVRQRERELKRMINKKGLGMETKTIIVPSSPPDPVHYDLDRKDMVEHALLNRMEMLELEVQLAMNNMEIEYNRNQTFPDFTFNYRYNISGLGADRGDSYDMLTDNDYNGHSFSLNVKVPIGNKRAKSQLRQSIYQRAQRLATRENRKAEIKSDVLNQIDTLEATWQAILASRQNTILSDEQYRAEKRQYELGLVKSTDVLDAQTNLAEAQRAEIASITEYQIALIDLAHATGTLLGAAKVEWAPIDPINENIVVKSVE
ncbi:MAG: TolC family protein [Deltaproteobacteria bacterium]|nr:TolC family protein [Deltaproteobacteria bacterium]